MQVHADSITPTTAVPRYACWRCTMQTFFLVKSHLLDQCHIQRFICHSPAASNLLAQAYHPSQQYCTIRRARLNALSIICHQSRSFVTDDGDSEARPVASPCLNTWVGPFGGQNGLTLVSLKSCDDDSCNYMSKLHSVNCPDYSIHWRDTAQDDTAAAYLRHQR